MLTLALLFAQPPYSETLDVYARELTCTPDGAVSLLTVDGRFVTVLDAEALMPASGFSDPWVGGVVAWEGARPVLRSPEADARPLRVHPRLWDGLAGPFASPDLEFMVAITDPGSGVWGVRSPGGVEPERSRLPISVATYIEDLAWLDARTALVVRNRDVLWLELHEEGEEVLTVAGSWALDGIRLQVAADVEGRGWVAAQGPETLDVYAVQPGEALELRGSVALTELPFGPYLGDLQVVDGLPVLSVGGGHLLILRRGQVHHVELRGLPRERLLTSCVRRAGRQLEFVYAMGNGEVCELHVQRLDLGWRTRLSRQRTQQTHAAAKDLRRRRHTSS
ncbi:MAG: hypothetical protein H6740_08000 [Alphaproteobacteria bacterium]|nr:hypothetical protein [Alphaproteobacteria bacterium]